MWALAVACGVALAAGLAWRAVGSGEGSGAARQPEEGSPAGRGGEGQRVYSASGHDITPIPPRGVQELARGLTEGEKDILLRKGTEQPFCGLLLDNKEPGLYACRLCGLPLFSSESKFYSGTGWPSFFQPVDEAHVHYERDFSFGMLRTEILCQRCRAHLGHVFEDGPPPTGMRYCLNSASLTFHKAGEPLPAESKPARGKASSA